MGPSGSFSLPGCQARGHGFWCPPPWGKAIFRSPVPGPQLATRFTKRIARFQRPRIGGKGISPARSCPEVISRLPHADV